VIQVVGRALSLGLVLSLAASEARAQEPQQRRGRVVFGSAPERPGARNSADLSGSFFQIYDDNILADRLPGGDPRVGESGTYPMGTVNMQYHRLGRGVTFSAAGGTSIRYYQQGGGRLDRNHHAAGSVDIPVGARTRVRLAQSAAFATYYTLMGLPGGTELQPEITLPGQELLLPSGEFGVGIEGGWEHHSGIVVSRQIGRANSLDGRYGLIRTSFAREETTRHDAGVTYRHGIGRQAAVRAGYGYQTGEGTLIGEPLVFHNVDLGFEYQRALTRSRNTTLSFSTGSAIVSGATTRDYRLLADASLVHLMGRSWSTTVAYHRGLEFIAALSNLVASDAFTATLGGFPNSRLQTSISATYSKGHLGTRHGDPLTTYSAVSRVQYALSRAFALEAQYLYYFYEFGAETARPAGVPPELARQSVRAGISLWLPLLR
jgi:hypothetical protein